MARGVGVTWPDRALIVGWVASGVVVPAVLSPRPLVPVAIAVIGMALGCAAYVLWGGLGVLANLGWLAALTMVVAVRPDLVAGYRHDMGLTVAVTFSQFTGMAIPAAVTGRRDGLGVRGEDGRRRWRGSRETAAGVVLAQGDGYVWERTVNASPDDVHQAVAGLGVPAGAVLSVWVGRARLDVCALAADLVLVYFAADPRHRDPLQGVLPWERAEAGCYSGPIASVSVEGLDLAVFVTLGDARAAVGEFVGTGGGRPTGLEWQETGLHGAPPMAPVFAR